jgi:hypothetical protein
MDLVSIPILKTKQKTKLGMICPDLDLDHLPECADIEICTDLIPVIGYLDVLGICLAGYVGNKKIVTTVFYHC